MQFRNSVPEFGACFRLIACQSSMQIGIPELDGIGRNLVGYLVDVIPESEELVVIDSGCGTGSRMFNIAEQDVFSTSEGKEISNLYLFHFNVLPFTICNLAYNLRFSTRLSKKHPNIWTFIQLIQREHVRFEHICIQLYAGATAPKQSKKTISFQKRFDTLQNRFLDKAMDANKPLSGLSLLIGKKNNKMLLHCQFSVFFSLN